MSKSEASKRISITAARDALRVLWPDFTEINGCVFVSCGGSGREPPKGQTATDWESFVNHTHVLDEFRNMATFENRTEYSAELDVVEEIYDNTHPDFTEACDLGQKIARIWASKLKLDFPRDRFRVYYTQYNNPIVRFHKVRSGESFWLSDEGLESATDPSFKHAVIYDTDYLDSPVVKL